MTVTFTVRYQSFNATISDGDKERAEAAITEAFTSEGILTDPEFDDAIEAYIARTECEEHDADLADRYERVVKAGRAALTLGWPVQPHGDVSLSVGRF